MTTPVQLKDLKPGDVFNLTTGNLTVETNLFGNEDDGYPIFIRDSLGAGQWLHRSLFTDATITRHDPPIEVGDVVRRIDGGPERRVRGIDDGCVWLTPSTNWSLFAALSDLTLISKGPAQ